MMKFKKIFIVILMLSMFLSGCQRQSITGMSKNNVSTSEKTPISDADASAEQPTGSIIKRDSNEIVEKVEKQEENKSALANIENNGDNLNGADGNNQNDDNNQSKPPSEELEPTWQDTAKKYAYKTGCFLYEHKGKIVVAVVLAADAYWFWARYANVVLAINNLQQQALQQQLVQQLFFGAYILHYQQQLQQQEQEDLFANLQKKL